ncbi:MAG: acetyl-CoA carboxylase biotin carboxylase subunit family protein [Hyalangium sp.]|uniref:ATP-grasp domain-containing protein n=1 Tax=Hyalangium sp. TaxID=2028555 RepID=UPI00389A8FFC
MGFVLFVTRWNVEVTVHLIEVTAKLPGIRLGLITGESIKYLPESARDKLVCHAEVSDVLDTAQLLTAARALSAEHGRIERIFGNWEYLQVPIAEVRETLGIEGMGVEAARNFRDKARMKDRWRAAGLPCARHRLVKDEAEALRFAQEVGYPVVVKPPAGMAARSTFRAQEPEALREAVRQAMTSAGGAALIEEQLSGQESSLEAVSLGGKVLWQSSSRYFLHMLNFLERPQEPYRVLLPREMPAPEHDAICRLAPRALQVLGMETGICHLEWFLRPDGSVALSEVAARPPGGKISTLISHAHDADFLLAWVRLLLFGAFEFPARQYAAGVICLRGQGSGRVRAVTGLQQAEDELGELIVEAQLPKINQPAAEGYEGEGYIILRHPETAVVEQGLRRLGDLIRVEMA